MTNKLTEREEELNETGRVLFFMVLGKLGYVIHDDEDTGEPGIKFEGSKNEMRDGAAIIGALSARLHEILLPIAYSVTADGEELSRMAGLQKRYLERVDHNFQVFMDKVLENDDEKIFRKHDGKV